MDSNTEASINSSFIKEYPVAYADFWSGQRVGVNLYGLSDAPALSYTAALLQWLSATSGATLVCNGSSPELGDLEPLFYENKQYLARTGKNVLAIGFPLVFVSDKDNTILSMPLFLWEVDLKRHPESFRDWEIRPLGKRTVRLNPILLTYFRRVLGMEIAHVLEQFVGSEHKASEALIQVYRGLKELVPSLNLPEQPGKLEPYPHVEHLEKKDNLISAYSIAVVGTFPLIFPDKGKPLDAMAKKDQILPMHRLSSHNVYALPLDPFQRQILEAVFMKGQRSVNIIGEPGTGKTHTLVQIALHALSERKKCLIVAPAVAGLKEIQERLVAQQAENWQFLLINVEEEGALFNQLLNNRIQLKGESIGSKTRQKWKTDLLVFHQKLTLLEKQFDSVRKPVLGKARWPVINGLYLASNREAGKEVLESQLALKDFPFDESSYLEVKKALATAELLYSATGKIKSSLSELSPEVFLLRSRKEAQDFVQITLYNFKDRTFKLKSDFGLFLNDYKDGLFAYYQKVFTGFREQIAALDIALNSANQQYGELFFSGTEVGLKWRSIFKSSYAGMIKSRQWILEAWKTLQNSFEKSPLAFFGFSPLTYSTQVREIESQLHKFSRELFDWRYTIAVLTQDESNRLSAKTMRSELNMVSRLESLDSSLESLLEDFNASGLFSRSFENIMLSVGRKLAFLEELMDFLEGIEAELPSFQSFFEWQRFWLELTEPTREIIMALIKSKAGNWDKTFNSWFYYHLLIETGSADFPESLPDFSAYVSLLEILRAQLPDQYRFIWGKEWNDLPKGKKRHFLQNRSTFNGISAFSTAWFNENFDLITTLNPLLLLSPAAAMEVLPDLTNQFDYVLVDNARFMDKGLLQLLPDLAAQQVLFYDGLPSGAIGEFPEITGGFQLSVCHRWPPGCMDVLANPTVQIAENAVRHFQVKLFQVDGRYDENEKTNDAEAAVVLKLLNDIEETPSRTLPKVVIVALTKEQRNLILSYIDRIKRAELPGAEKIRQLERNGLLVCHPADLVGIHAHVLLISFTFGPVNIKGDLPARLEIINSEEALLSLHLLTGRALSDVYAVNSIPEQILEPTEVFESNASNRGLQYLIHYLKYLKALSISDGEGQGMLVKNLSKPAFVAKQQLLSGSSEGGALYDWIANELGAFFPKECIHRDLRRAQFSFPLAVRMIENEESWVVILLDGFWSEEGFTDMEWEFERTRVFESYHFKPVLTFSIQWFLQPTQELGRLVAAIQKKSSE